MLIISLALCEIFANTTSGGKYLTLPDKHSKLYLIRECLCIFGFNMSATGILRLELKGLGETNGLKVG